MQVLKEGASQSLTASSDLAQKFCSIAPAIVLFAYTVTKACSGSRQGGMDFIS